MLIEQHIENLWAGLNNAVTAAKRRQIEAELELAQTELAAMLAEEIDPPF